MLTFLWLTYCFLMRNKHSDHEFTVAMMSIITAVLDVLIIATLAGKA